LVNSYNPAKIKNLNLLGFYEVGKFSGWQIAVWKCGLQFPAVKWLGRVFKNRIPDQFEDTPLTRKFIYQVTNCLAIKSWRQCKLQLFSTTDCEMHYGLRRWRSNFLKKEDLFSGMEIARGWPSASKQHNSGVVAWCPVAKVGWVNLL